jgi:hypothetical protein
VRGDETLSARSKALRGDCDDNLSPNETVFQLYLALFGFRNKTNFPTSSHRGASTDQ